MEWYAIIFILVVMAVLLVLWKKGILTLTTTQGIGEAVETLAPLMASGSVFEKLVHYAGYAFQAAEQLMKIGEIAAEDRKETALTLVQQYAETDGVELTQGNLDTVDSLLEANCSIQGHTTATTEKTTENVTTETLQDGSVQTTTIKLVEPEKLG